MRFRRPALWGAGFLTAVAVASWAALPAASASAAPSAAAHAATARPDASPAVHIPQDEAPHAQPDEWWYFSGHLTGTDPAGHKHTYGFEYVIFQFLDEGPAPVYFGDLSISDLSRHTFTYAVREDSYPVPKTKNSFTLHAGAWKMSGGNGRDKLSAALPGYSLGLQLSTTEPAVLHGNGGLIPYGPFGTSDYYSWTSLATSGVIIDHGVKIKVTGLSWMDHQWGAFDFASGAGWDWFSMQLSNGQQYMLYLIRNEKGKIVATIGTRVADDGHQVTHLPAGSFTDKATRTWTSPVTGITYGDGWQVTVPGGHLTVTADLADSEVDLIKTQGSVYWEGDVAITGEIASHKVKGTGYTEINPPAA
jgi:predicted secreted hydrolase